jgi:phage terminase large subunit-like protein
MLNKSDRYIENIITGKVYHGKYVLRAIKNLENDKLNSDLWVYNSKIADKYIRFIEHLVFTEGEKKGQNIDLENWQSFYISQIFGWVSKTDETRRRFIETTLCVPRKNGKSTLIGIIALACAYLDDEARGQIYMAATSQKQARLCFDSAWYAVKQTKGLSSRISVSAHNLLVNKNQTYIRYISSEAGGIEGTNPSVAVLDEEHLATDNLLREALRLGMGSRKNPLFISISTAGTDKNGPYYKHLKICKKFIDGIIPNDRHFAIIYEPDSNMDWRLESTWKVANPNWGVSIDPDLFRQDFVEATNEASKQPMFVTKRLNIWADSAKTWIDAKKWDNLGSEKRIEDYYGKEAYIGLDLGATGDFSAMAIMIPNEDRTKMTLFMKFYIPSDMAEKRTRADQINFIQWAREGWITLTDGDATDYNVIKEDMVKYCSKFQYKPIAYDKALASMFMVQLMNDYQIQVEAYSQSVGSVTGPTKQFYEWIMNGTIQHDNNPVMAWMISNVEVYQDDANGNYKIHKGKSKNKVDGPCAVVNSIGRMLEEWKDNPNIYNYVF